jgi:hypothetical protein
MGATRNGIADADPGSSCTAPPVIAMPSNAPMHERKRSGHLTATGPGAKLDSQRLTADLNKIGPDRKETGYARQATP